MPSEFVEDAHRAFGNITAPEAPISGIRERARNAAAGRRTMLLRAAAVAVLSFGAIGGAAAGLSSQLRVWMSGGHAAVDVRQLDMMSYPRSTELADLMQRAAFPVVLPLGLPRGARLASVMSAPALRPTSILLRYSLPDGNWFSIVLTQTTAITQSAPPSAFVSSDVETWTAGAETASVKPGMRHANEVKAAMRNATPASSLAANGAFLVKGIVLNAHQLAAVPALVRKGAPLVDNRRVTLTDIPRTSNGPDYQHAKYHWDRSIAVPAAGVREVAAYLKAHPGASRTLIYDPTAPPNARVGPLH